MPLTKLQFKPGINRETTSYSNEGGWFDGDKVRFRFGFPEKIGGWERTSDSQYLGTVRAMHPFTDLEETKLLGMGTTLKYYILEGLTFNDITPLRTTLTSPDTDNCFETTDTSTTVTVNIPSHGATDNDFVTFSGATAVGGVPAGDLNKEHQITFVDGNTFTITVDTAATSTVAAGGGTAISAAFQINTGLDLVVPGTGWGAGTYGRGAWDSASSNVVVTDQLRLWTHDNFGEDLIINVRNGDIYYWDRSASTIGNFQRAEKLSTLAGADGFAPTVAKKVLVSDRDRHVIAFGCDPVDDLGTQDPLLIRFSNQEDPLTWNPTATNTAGDLRLGSGSRIVTAVETRQQILVITDESAHAMQFLGPPFTFGINQISENTTILGPNVAVAVDDTVFWMGAQEFYVYSGSVQRLPCTVRDYVFDDFNYDQGEKTFASLNSSFSEVWWFYPSSSSTEVDSYVVYNYQQQVWYYGTLARTAWIDRGINTNPIAAGTDGYLYTHEVGNDDGSTVPATGINAYIESSQIDIGDGDRFAFIRRLIPDLTFRDSTATSPTANFILKARNFPGGTYDQTTTSGIVRSATVPVEQFTNQANIRLRGRSFAIRVESDGTEVAWRLGSPRVDIRQDGGR